MDAQKKILLVDDEAQTLGFLAHILERAGYDVISTTRGRDAIELAKEHRPDLIILDVVMPDLLGGEVSNILSREPATKDISVIFLSGLNTKEDQEIVKAKTGKYHTLAKPVTAEELLEAVDKTLSA